NLVGIPYPELSYLGGVDGRRAEWNALKIFFFLLCRDDHIAEAQGHLHQGDVQRRPAPVYVDRLIDAGISYGPDVNMIFSGNEAYRKSPILVGVRAAILIQNMYRRTCDRFTIRTHHAPLQSALLTTSQKASQHHADTQYNRLHDIHRLLKAHKIQPVLESNKRPMRCGAARLGRMIFRVAPIIDGIFTKLAP